MRIGVVRETYAGEKRVALTPASLGPLKKAGFEVLVETAAGVSAGYSDAQYEQAGATVTTREAVLEAEVVAVVRYLGADPTAAFLAGRDQAWIGQADPLSHPKLIEAAAAQNARTFSLELIPRITRAQAMDVLSSQANLAGYKAVLLGANELDRVLPMMTTAAGTLTPAKALILGAGVAGLQAIATARRLGAVVTGYDVRPEVKTQIESLGARFLDLGLEAEQGTGGYAAQQSEEFYREQQRRLGDALADMDLVVTTAAVPGRRAPILITDEMLAKMHPGSVVVDLAAERGGNVAATRPGETIDVNGVRILGPLNLPSSLAHHASAVYAKNVANFLLNMTKDKALTLNMEDPIVSETLLTNGGELVNERVKGAL